MAAGAEADAAAAASFLRTLHFGQETGYLSMLALTGEMSEIEFVSLADDGWPERAAEIAMKWQSTRNVYVAVGIQRARLERGRGGADAVVALPGLWLDIDVFGPNHRASNLPPTIKDARRLIREAVPVSPSLCVLTGGGLQPYWLFREPLEIEHEQDRQYAERLIRSFQARARSVAAEHGWGVDPTHDLCRPLRLPGTFNRKNAPVFVTFEETPGCPRYNPSELEDLLDLDVDPEVKAHTHGSAPTAPRADFGSIVEGCSWVREASSARAPQLPEPEWYRLLSVVSRCVGGRSIAHEISSPYPKYSRAKTDDKFDQARDASGPVTCGYVANELGQEKHCRACAQRGRVKSPVVLGLKRTNRAAAVQSEAPSPELSADCPSQRARVVSIAGDSGWRDLLIGNDRGAPCALLVNAQTALKLAPEWADVLAFNEFSVHVQTLKPTPWGKPAGEQWTDDDDRQVRIWLEREGIRISTSVTGEAVLTVANETKIHPVRDYLNSLEWDNTPRIGQWAQRYLGADPKKPIACTFGRLWLISAVARILEPGCKADCCLILEGAQGIGKSTALRTLAGEWFTDQIEDLGSKDSRMQCHGVWIIEIAELDSIHRSEVSRIKAFMSATFDRFRLPYGKNVTSWPRGCVFAGSTNLDTYLRDETGGRRFWPIQCGAIDLDGLRADRDQLWAEAVAEYREGKSWWLEDAKSIEAAETEQKARLEVDAWAEKILEAIAGLEEVTTSQVLQRLDRPIGQWTKSDAMRIAAVLKSQGWTKVRGQIGAERPWLYRRPQ